MSSLVAQVEALLAEVKRAQRKRSVCEACQARLLPGTSVTLGGAQALYHPECYLQAVTSKPEPTAPADTSQAWDDGSPIPTEPPNDDDNLHRLPPRKDIDQ